MTEIENVDIHRVDYQYESFSRSFNEANILKENKSLCLEFINELKIGWGTRKKLTKYRLVKYFIVLKAITIRLEALEKGLTYPNIQKKHVKELLTQFDNNKKWSANSIQDYREILRRFVTWIRKEQGYPEGYPDRERLNLNMGLRKYPLEVDFSAPKPNLIKNIDEIPTEQEVNNLIRIWDIFREESGKDALAARNQAIMAIITEVGIRIGGLGNRIIRDVIFDDLGARLIVTDKTMRNQPVRLITSVPYLREWLRLHPRKNEPDAPLWVSVADENEGPGHAMTYQSFLKILNRSRALYNKYAKKNNLPQITRRLHYHAFRYYAQTRDMLDQMPISVMCAQRGWKIDSKRPQTYARVSTQQVDEWLAARYNKKTEAPVIEKVN